MICGACSNQFGCHQHGRISGALVHTYLYTSIIQLYCTCIAYFTLIDLLIRVKVDKQCYNIIILYTRPFAKRKNKLKDMYLQNGVDTPAIGDLLHESTITCFACGSYNCFNQRYIVQTEFVFSYTLGILPTHVLFHFESMYSSSLVSLFN